MIVKVMSESKAKKESFRLNIPTIIISITDTFDEPVKFNKNKFIIGILNLHFDDEENGPNIMTEEDCINIKNFIDRNKDKVSQIIVHCEAGVSRSPAVAAAIMIYLDEDDWVIWNNPKFCPNRHCFEMLVSEFELKRSLLIMNEDIEERFESNIRKWKECNGIE